MKKNKKSAKKRIMFIQNEDYNFLAYNLLIFLDEFKCYDEKSRFKDFRKIAYLIEFISGSPEIEDYTTIELSDIYLKAQLKKKLLSHLILTLQNKDYLDISLNTTHKTISLWINKEKIPKDFFDKEKFQREIVNIKKLKKDFGITKVSKLTKLIDGIFKNRGVSTWEV